MWLINTITATVTGKGKGEVSVKFVDDEEVSLSLNRIVVDLSDGAEPVKIVKYEGTPVISGSLVDELKDQILDIFQDSLSDGAIGVYQINAEGIQKL